jgi:shikimate kinase
MKIQLVGPGGAGKSTVGVLLSDRLQTRFVDLDQCFRQREGDISNYCQRYGYQAYARQNVEVYRSIVAADDGVMALSSGFMTYAEAVHPRYVEIRAAIAESSMTFVLLPSLDLETCVAEIVRRQAQLCTSSSESGGNLATSRYGGAMASNILIMPTMPGMQTLPWDLARFYPMAVLLVIASCRPQAQGPIYGDGSRPSARALAISGCCR